MSDERKRPGNNRGTTDEKPTDQPGPPNQGLAWWLSRAPPTATFLEVYQASEEYDSPDEAWPDEARPDGFGELVEKGEERP